MNEYPNPSNIPNTWSQAAQSTTSSFNNYALNTKWAQTQPNQSQSSTPTNPSTLTATFPSFSGGIPPLYPSISAQSSNSIQGGAPSPFGPQNVTSNAPNASNIGGQTTSTHTKTHYDKNSISQSSSASSLNALSGGMSKLHINTSYNPYNAGFTPSDFANNSNANTPNLQNSNGTPTGFRFNNYSNPYSSIATPTTPLNATPINKWNAANTLQTTAAMNNINAMNMNYNKIYNVNQLRMKMNVANATASGNLSANSSFGALPHLSNPSSANHSKTNLTSPQNDTTTTKTDVKDVTQCKLNSNAVPYQPLNTLKPVANTLKPSSVEVMKSQQLQQLQHQQKAERVPYSYPSYADAVSKTEDVNVVQVAAAAAAAPAAAPVAVKESAEESLSDKDVIMNQIRKMSSESEEAIQALNPLTWPCNPRHAKFYVIKSFGEDDVHKSIKYNLWCSTERGNRKLDEAFNESKRINQVNTANLKTKDNKDIDPRDTTRGCPVYLFFSVNRSGCFCGMAQMISNYYKDRHFGSWVQDGKWQGSFIVKWIYVKDIPNKDLKDIQLPNNDNRPVTFSRDTQEIPFAQGIEMLRRFIKYEPKTNILQDFKYYDDRERDIKHKRTQQIILQQLQPQMGSHAHGINKEVDAIHNNTDLNMNMNMNTNLNNNMYESAYNKYDVHDLHRGRNTNTQIMDDAYANYGGAPQKRHWQQNKRKYYSKNDRNNDRNNNRGHGYNRSNNRYNNQQQQSQYGNYQILKRNPQNQTPPNTTNTNAINAINAINANAIKSNNINAINPLSNATSANNIECNEPNDSNRQRYNNRGRNQWVRK